MLTGKILAHRGSSGNYPENTLLSFQKALEEGAEGIELDIHYTKDGEIVVIHDEYVRRTFNGSERVEDATLQQLKALKISQHYRRYPAYHESWEELSIPTLQEVLQLLDGSGVLLNIEIKTTAAAYTGMLEKTVQLLEQFYPQQEVLFSSFHYPSLAQLKRLAPHYETAWLVPFCIPRLYEYPEFLAVDGLHLEQTLALSEIGHELQQKTPHVPIRLWTVNEADDITAAFENGFGSVITDFPATAVALRKKVAEQLLLF